mgnify:CR=1 FL=1|tara:strand:- start:632 stop:832 length:201 start_codon:yes stop_codon:yes gene_type:complete
MYPTWKRVAMDCYATEECLDGVPDYQLIKLCEGHWILKQRNSPRPEFFKTRKEALRFSASLMTKVK